MILNNLVYEIIKKNPSINLVLLGNEKNVKPLLAKFKLLCGVSAKDIDIDNDLLDFVVPSSHLLVSAKQFGLVSDIISRNSVSSFRDYNFIYNLTGVGIPLKDSVVKRLISILSHPALFIDTDNYDAILCVMGLFYQLDRNTVIKVFDLYNNQHIAFKTFNI